jgi:hypothetical protein
MNQFYFNPALDVLDPYSSWPQWRVFFRQNECGLLNQVQKLTIPQKWLIRFHTDLVASLPTHCPALKEVVIVYGTRCLGVLGGRYQCRCKTKSMIQYAELTEEAKLEREARSIAQRDGIGCDQLKYAWESSTALAAFPCPTIRSVAICFRSRRWSPLDRISMADFTLARLLRKPLW